MLNSDLTAKLQACAGAQSTTLYKGQQCEHFRASSWFNTTKENDIVN